jgi:hypothetical protein
MLVVLCVAALRVCSVSQLARSSLPAALAPALVLGYIGLLYSTDEFLATERNRLRLVWKGLRLASTALNSHVTHSFMMLDQTLALMVGSLWACTGVGPS